MTDFGLKVRIKLLEMDKSMKSLADDLNITNAYLSDILRGNRKAESQKKRIAKLLGIDYEEGKEKEAVK